MSGQPDPATAAFEQLRSEVALLRRAVEGLAAKGDEKPVNYAPTLGKLSKGVAEVSEKVDDLAGQPIISLSPESLGRALSDAAAQVLAAPVAEFTRGREELKQAVGRLRQSTTALAVHGLAADRRAIVYAAAAAAAATLVAWIGLSGPIARALPARWQVAERMAAATLALPRGDAGAKLMAGAAPGTWEKLRIGHRLISDNEETLDRCQKEASKAQQSVTCEVKVKPQAQSDG